MGRPFVGLVGDLTVRGWCGLVVVGTIDEAIDEADGRTNQPKSNPIDKLFEPAGSAAGAAAAVGRVRF